MSLRLTAALILLGFCQLAKSQPEPLETGTLSDGVPIYYQIHGSSEGHPVLFIHPFGTYFDEIRFSWIIEFFSDYRFIAMDVRGHGRSGKPSEPEDYGLNLVEDVDRLLDHLKLTDTHIIGASMGAIVGLKYASLHKQRVRSLTLLGQGLVPPESYQGWVQMGKDVMASEERTPEQEENLHIYSGFLQGYPPLLVPETAASSLDIPLLIVIGEEDERLDIARKLKEVYPATNLIVAPGFKHANIMNQDSPFFLSITGFLSQSEEVGE